MSDQVGQQLALQTSSAQPTNSNPRAGLTNLLRVGLGDNRVSVGTTGLTISLPVGVNPFDYFAGAAEGDAGSDATAHRQDLPSMPVSAADGDAAGPATLSIVEMRVARMIQMMAGFGRSAGEAELRNREGEGVRFDYFA
jgi:hypothetical protein